MGTSVIPVRFADTHTVVRFLALLILLTACNSATETDVLESTTGPVLGPAHLAIIIMMQSDRFRVEAINSDTLRHRPDVMLYFTGLVSVDAIDTNTYRPGAIADHLTSAGGQLTGSSQMSSLRWLSAGATGSYGSVVEPCAFVQKFPRPNIVINRYLNGETLLEAYWKSVEWPGQGVFIGEPLAAPFRK